MVCATSKGYDQTAHMQSDQSLCKSLVYSMTVELLTKQHLEFLCLKEGCPDSSESTHVKMPHSWKSHVATQYYGLRHETLVLIATFVLRMKMANSPEPYN